MPGRAHRQRLVVGTGRKEPPCVQFVTGPDADTANSAPIRKAFVLDRIREAGIIVEKLPILADEVRLASVAFIRVKQRHGLALLLGNLKSAEAN